MTDKMFDYIDKFKLVFKKKPVRTEDCVFKLHTKITMTILIVCQFIITLKQFFGEPINCYGISADFKEKVVNSFCWLSIGVHTLVNGSNNSAEAAYLGLGSGIEASKKHIPYYQWIWFFITLQAFMFTIPAKIWKRYENDLMDQMVKDLNDLNVEEEKQENKKKVVVNYFVRHVQANLNEIYASWFFRCELLNFLNVIFQMCAVNIFLNNSFASYGFNYFSSNVNPEHDLFPKVAKCQLNTHGPSGNIVPHDFFCILGINIVHEKIFLFMWFWFIMLSAVSFINLLFRLMTILNFCNIRAHLLYREQQSVIDHSVILSITRKLEYGDWFVLQQLGRNLDPLVFCNIVNMINKILDGKGPSLKEEKMFCKEGSLMAIKNV